MCNVPRGETVAVCNVPRGETVAMCNVPKGETVAVCNVSRGETVAVCMYQEEKHVNNSSRCGVSELSSGVVLHHVCV